MEYITKYVKSLNRVVNPDSFEVIVFDTNDIRVESTTPFTLQLTKIDDLDNTKKLFEKVR